MKKALTILVMMAAVWILPTPLMAADKPTPVAAEPTLVGVYLPMTGDVASLGQMAWDGIRAANEMMPEVLGRDIQLILEDTKSDKEESAKAVERLIRTKKVGTILGEAISSNSIAGGPIGERYEVPMVTPTATNPLVTQGNKYYFRVCFSDPFQGEIASMLALMTLRARSAVVIVDINQDYSVGLGNYFVKSFTRWGGKVPFTTYIRTGDKDFSEQLAAVQAAKPDIIYAPDYYGELALLAKQAMELGVNTPILAGDAAQSEELIKLGGKAVEGMYFTAHFSPAAVNTKLGKDFMAFYKKKYNRELDGFGAMGADAYFVLIDAMQRSGSTVGPRVREGLASTRDFQGVSGKISIGEDGNAIKGVVINQVKDGKFVYVTSMSPTFTGQ
jgi:branched-chain amino acid transport system substrate-binding protein